MEKTYIEYKNGHCISLLKLCGLFIIGLFVVTNANAQENNADSLIRNQNEISSKSYKYTVKGNVIDGSTHLGFAGARINVVNEPISAMTEDDGSFEIKVPHLDVTLSIEAPGYQTQIVALKGRQELSVQMLKPVGETSFYDQVTLQAKNSFLIADFSPNIVTIDEDISSRLNGQLRSITHSGNPQGGSAIFVNGLNSLNTTAQPLYVVDGVIWQIQDDITSIHSGFYNNPLAVIDPADVEKITVMKNGTSIYGAKGANGVVFIDTKRGHSPSTEIAVDLSFGYRSPFNSISVMDAGEYRLYASDIISGMFKNTSDVEKRFKFLDDDPTRSYYKANHNNTDWVNLVNKDAWNQSYGIKVNGGDEVALYAFSLGYTNSEGNIKDSDFNRLNIRFNSDINLTDKFKVKFDIAFAQTQNKVWNDGMDSISSPYFLSLIKSPLYSDYKYNSNGNLSNLLSDTDEMGIGNPLAIFDKGAGMSKNYVLNANIRPSYSFLNDKIKVGVLFSYSWNKLDENSFVPDYGTAEYALYNQQGEVYGISKNKVQDRMDKHQSILVDGRVDWNIFKNSLNNFDVFAGYRFYSDTYKARYANGHNTGSDNTPMLQYTASELRDAYGIDEAWKSMSWYANADYSYKNKYFLNASAAMDASSRFGTDVDDAIHIGGASWGVFPSVMAGWLISSENFMEKVNAINFLKLNLGYGISGNDNLPNTATRSYFSSVKFNGKAYGLTLDNIGNEKLKWETTATAHIGLDASLFNNRW